MLRFSNKFTAFNGQQMALQLQCSLLIIWHHFTRSLTEAAGLARYSDASQQLWRIAAFKCGENVELD